MRSRAALTVLLTLSTSCGQAEDKVDEESYLPGYYVADTLSLCLNRDGSFLLRSRSANRASAHRGRRWTGIVPYSGSMIVVLDSLRLPGDAGWMVDEPQTMLESNWPPSFMRPTEAHYGRLTLTARAEQPIVFLRVGDESQCT